MFMNFKLLFVQKKEEYTLEKIFLDIFSCSDFFSEKLSKFPRNIITKPIKKLVTMCSGLCV